MKKNTWTFLLGAFVLVGVVGALGLPFAGSPSEASMHESRSAEEVPAKGIPTLLDLGAHECIPCKMMVPVLEKVEKKYQGKAAVIFIDVRKDKAQAQRYGIRAIPTQIFFNAQGEEVYRHEGFMSEEHIDQVFSKMGVSSRRGE